MISGMVPHGSQAEALVGAKARAHAGAGCSGWCRAVPSLLSPHPVPFLSDEYDHEVTALGYKITYVRGLKRFAAALSLLLSETGIT